MKDILLTPLKNMVTEDLNLDKLVSILKNYLITVFNVYFRKN